LSETGHAGFHDQDSLPSQALTAPKMAVTFGDNDLTKDTTSLVDLDVDVKLSMLVNPIHGK
jgi:hypothetical protein